MKKKVMNALENFSKAMLQPLMYLSVGGLILAIGALLTNSAISGALPFLKWAPIQILGNLMYQTIYVIVNNLAVLFVIGIPAAMAKKDKHHAGIIGLMSYLMYLTTSNVLLSTMGQLAEPNEMLGLLFPDYDFCIHRLRHGGQPGMAGGTVRNFRSGKRHQRQRCFWPVPVWFPGKTADPDRTSPPGIHAVPVL